VVKRVAGRVNTGREVEDSCMVTGVGAVVRKGATGQRRGKGKGDGFQWLNVDFRRRTNVT
jgi:hypothetical protein